NLFEYVDAIEDVYQYPGEMNDIYGWEAIAKAENYSIYIKDIIFTDHDVYVLVSLEGNALGNLDINGCIVTDDQQTVYELDSKWKEIEQVEELRYFFFTGNMSDMFNLKNRQLTEEAMLELDVNFKGTEHQFHTNVENVSTD